MIILENSENGIHFGIFAPPLYQQLNLLEEDVQEFQLISDSINNLYLSEIISDKESLKFRQKLLKQIEKFLKKKMKK